MRCLVALLFLTTASAAQLFQPSGDDVVEGAPLNEHDFAQAALLPSVFDRPPRRSENDQRFRVRSRRGSVVSADKDKWPNARVPYIISAAYTDAQRAVIARAIAAYTTRTCIRFVPKTSTDKDYVVIAKLDGCYADFARVGGRQQVSLADECIDYATIIHELMHVIGFIHEHQRDDRDGYVSILYQNIIPGANTDFDKLSGLGLSYYGEAYDYFSIMHYESNEGSRNGKNTIEAKQAVYTRLMGKSTDFSRSDLNRINRAYSCYAYLTAAQGTLPANKRG